MKTWPPDLQWLSLNAVSWLKFWVLKVLYIAYHFPQPMRYLLTSQYVYEGGSRHKGIDCFPEGYSHFLLRELIKYDLGKVGFYFLYPT